MEDIVIFYGENEFEIENSINKRREGFEIIEIEEGIDFADLVNCLNTPALFSGNSLYIIRNESIFKDDEHLDVLTEYLSNPSPFSKCIIAINKKIDTRKKAVKYFKEKGLLFEYGYKKGRMLEKWIKEYIWSKGYSIDNLAITYLIEVVGDKQDMLKSEIEKIFLYEPDNKKIEIELLRKILSNNVESNIFNLTGSLFKDNDKALRSLDNLIMLKEPIPLIIFMLIRELRILIRCKWLLKEKFREDKIMSTLGIHPYYGKEKLKLVRKITFSDLFKYLKSLYDLEVKIKSGKGDSVILLKATLLGIK